MGVLITTVNGCFLCEETIYEIDFDVTLILHEFGTQVRFILEEAGVKEEHIGKVIALRPQLIGTGLTLRLQPLVKYFRNQQLKREDIGRMVADFPMLLRYNLAIIESKFRYFKRAMKRPFEDLISFPRYVIACFQIVLSQNPLLKFKLYILIKSKTHVALLFFVIG